MRGDVTKRMLDEEVGMEVRQRKDFCSRSRDKEMEATALKIGGWPLARK